ncbi:conserved protein of unknown function [Paraburkholderia kururiensis]
MRISRIFARLGLSAPVRRVIKLNTFNARTSRIQRFLTIMSARFYFYFFWYLRPLADREGC